MTHPIQFKPEKRHVSPVALEENVEDVAQYRDCTDRQIQQTIQSKARKHEAANAHPSALHDHRCRGQEGYCGTDAGDEPQDRVPADRDTEDGEAAVQGVGKPLEPIHTLLLLIVAEIGQRHFPYAFFHNPGIAFWFPDVRPSCRITGLGQTKRNQNRARPFPLGQLSGGEAMSRSSSLKDEAEKQAAHFAEHLKETARSKADQQASALRDHAADRVKRTANAANAAADQFDPASLQAEAVRRVADRVDDIAAQIRDGDLSSMMTQVQNFARRNPALFVGGAVLAGFAATRFLKASDPRSIDTLDDDPWGSAQHETVLAQMNGDGAHG